MDVRTRHTAQYKEDYTVVKCQKLFAANFKTKPKTFERNFVTKIVF